MHVIIDYNVGNLASVKQGFLRAGIETTISQDEVVIRNASSLILPGVGAFKESLDALKQSGLIPAILDHINSNKPLIGICLGMQLLYEFSEEYGRHQGLGIFKGTIKKITGDVKIPHMGWNTLEILNDDPIVSNLKEASDVYFVHSYYADSSDGIIATTNYGVMIPAIIKKGNVYATQFHPEKSGDIGIEILKGYKKIL
jgi:imidazole glycerol-phosphate synthase subunit HisH